MKTILIVGTLLILALLCWGIVDGARHDDRG